MGGCSSKTGFAISQLVLAEMRLAAQAGDLATYTGHLQDLALHLDELSKSDKKLVKSMQDQHLQLLTQVDKLTATSVPLPNSSIVLKRSS